MANARGRRGGGRGALIPKARLSAAERAAKAARKAARAELIPTPGSKRGDRAWQRFLPDTEEVRWLKKASLTELLAGGTGEYQAELRSIAGREHRRQYAAQQRRRAKAKPKGAWIRVKSHRRRRPGGKA